MQATKIDLMPFCSKDVGLLRYAIDKPFVKDGYRFATDTHKLIRVKADEPNTKFDDKPPPNCAALFKAFEIIQGELAPWPDESGLVDCLRACRTCDGNGETGTIECPECDGSGVVECPHCGSDDECEECDGDGCSGGEKCQDCNGNGERLQPWKIKCGSLWCRIDHYMAVQALPNPRFACDEHQHMILVQFDGGEAIVMSLDDAYDR